MCSSSDLSDEDISDQYVYSSASSTCSDVTSASRGPEHEKLEEPFPSPMAAPVEEEREEEEEEKKKKKKKKERTPGVIYLSRVPPFMKPHKLKHLLSPYGRVGRIYLQPEDDSTRTRRIKFGGNKKRNFTEGWVEFLDKRVAKAVAMALNNVPMGGKKSNYYRDDIWNIKYLANFRWTHLTEKIAYEKAVEQQLVRTEISQAKRENKHYLSNVDKGKEISAIVERKRKHGASEEQVASKNQMSFKQRRTDRSRPQTGEDDTAHSNHGSQLSDNLLRKILPN